MAILLFGPQGQVGREIVAAAARGATDLIALSRAEADLAAPGAAAAAIARFRPSAIINAAAWTAVDKAETERAAALRLNAGAVAEIAEAATRVGARLIHISTDYVFDGESAKPLAEDAPTKPVNYYGETKLAGERAALAAPEAVVIRTSWVYSVHGDNFLKTMLKLSETKNELGVVADQKGAPTPAAAIAAASLKIAAARNGGAGLYHFQGAPPCVWADFAEAIFAAAGRQVKVNRIPSADWPTPAKRPQFSVLDCARIARDHGILQPDWRPDAAACVARLLAASAA